MRSDRQQSLRLWGLVVLFLVATGCGSSSSSSGTTTTATTSPGVTVDGASDIPSLNIDDYDFVGVDTAADLSLPASLRHGTLTQRLQQATLKGKRATENEGNFSEAFCNQKNCLLQTLRQALDMEAFACFIRKTGEALPNDFTFGTNQFKYFKETFEDVPDDAGGGAITILSRLKEDSEGRLIAQVCEQGQAQPFVELVINPTTINSVDGIDAVVTNIDTESNEEAKSQFSFRANCLPSAFLSSALCELNITSKFQDPMGSGNIRFAVAGGASAAAITHTLEANFAAGGTAGGELASNLLLRSEWGAGSSATGASNVNFGDGGVYPAFPQLDIAPRGDNDPIFTVCPRSNFYCDNPEFDPEDFDDENPTCPYVVAANEEGGVASCPIAEGDRLLTDCYNIDGTALVDQTGTVLDCDNSTVATHKAAVESGTTLSKETSISYVEDWANCADEGTVTTIDVSAIDFTECFDGLADADDELATDTCFQQGAEANQGEAFDGADKDSDGDGVGDLEDNCPFDSNTDQAESGGEGTACGNDFDGDGVLNDTDNCRFTPNADQSDSDSDDFGNECSDYADFTSFDSDEDTVTDGDDNCLFDSNLDQADADDDDVGDACDACPDDADDSCIFENEVVCADSAPCNNDFECQLFADEDQDDEFRTDNVQCNSDNCCELK